MTYSPYMPTDTVDESAAYTEMQGPSSMVNELAGRASWSSSPTKCLVGMWFVALAVYWFFGWLFRGQRA
jgi:hypothetical protein